MRLINRRGRRLLGQLERSTCATAGGLNASRRLRTQQEQRTAPGAVRSNDECLLDVGGLRRTGDEDAKAGAFEADSLVGFMHVIDNRAARHDEHEVLGDHEDGSVRAEAGPRYPNCTVLGDSQLAWDDGDIEAFELMQVVYTGEIKGEFADAWDQRYDFARLSSEA